MATAQVADLFRQAEMVDDALALYKKAIELAPNNPQYHEYLGEYLHNLKRSDEARAAWAKIAEGPNKNAKNLTRLAEVLAGFGYVKEAITPLSEAVALEKDDFSLRLMLAGYFNRLERYDEAETQLAAAGKLAERDEEKTAVLEARVKNDQAAGRLAARIEALQQGDWIATRTQVRNAGPCWRVTWRPTASSPRRSGPPTGRSRSTPRSIAAWTLAARVRESAGSLGDSADALRRLAEIDRRNRTEHLMALAKIESRLGRTDAALKAGRDLLAAAPGNPDNYEYFAQLCFQLGRSEEGLDALRRAVRANPNDTKIILTLAETLAGQYQTEEAIEIYWRAFDRTDDLDAKLGVVSKLTELYLQRNQFDRLLTRLAHQDRDNRAVAAPGRAPQTAARRGDLRGPGTGDLGRPGRCPLRARAVAGRQYARYASSPATLEAGRGRGRHRERRPISETAQRSGAQRRGDDAAGATVFALRRAGGSPGALGEDGFGQGRGIPRLPGHGRPACRSEAATRAGDQRVACPQRPARLGGTLSQRCGPGGARQIRGGRPTVSGLARL